MFASVILALAVLAQDPSASRAAGDRMLAEQQAGDTFRNVTDRGDIRLKHSASGMVCSFDPGAVRNNVRLYPVRPGIERRGDDVGCGTTPDMAYTIYATRYRPEISQETAMAQAIDEIEAIWSDVERLDLSPPAGAANSPFAAFRGRHPNGQMLSTVVLVQQVGQWTFKMRASGPPGDVETLADSAAERFTAQLPQPVPPSR